MVEFDSEIGMSGNLVPQGTRGPAGTHQNFKNDFLLQPLGWKLHPFRCKLWYSMIYEFLKILKISIFKIFNENHKKGNFGSCVASYFFLTRSLLLFYLLPTVLSLFFLYVPLLYHRFSLEKTPETNETLFHFYDLFSGEGKVIKKIGVKIFFIESEST